MRDERLVARIVAAAARRDGRHELQTNMLCRLIASACRWALGGTTMRLGSGLRVARREGRLWMFVVNPSVLGCRGG